jgi:hypothetical protein
MRVRARRAGESPQTASTVRARSQKSSTVGLGGRLPALNIAARSVRGD